VSTTAFTACFAVRTIFSIIGLGIKDELGVSETEFGLLIGTPILTGSLSRIILGDWSDQFDGRRPFAAVMVLAAAATFRTAHADSYAELLAAALEVGLAGGSFSVGAAYVSKFYPAGRQGTAPGISGRATWARRRRSSSRPSLWSPWVGRWWRRSGRWRCWSRRSRFWP
jgi:NNP family nitrate/nitrite transporter-like MFS transporter